VVATTDAGTELFIGDAAYTRAVWEHEGARALPDGQAADLDTWRATLTDLKALAPKRIHFCHDR
jgi:glyoxylase-like metal-dependent hydrolase (beta-lactamase superfamily II)